MSDLITTHDNMSEPFLLLTPKTCIPRAPSISGNKEVDEVLSSCATSRILALDFETAGGDYSYGHIQIVGMGLAWDNGVTYFHWSELSEYNQRKLLASVAQHPGLIAHNIYFDGGVLLTNHGKHASWMCDTYSLLAMLSNEGYPGRTWGLKKAQAELLLWTETNEVELDEWLCMNGHYIGVRRTTTDPAELGQLYRDKSLRADKSKMHLAPRDILGKYCCLDAESCYLLFTEILEPVGIKFPGFMEFVCGDYMTLILVHIDQKLCGLPLDRAGTEQRARHLEAEMLRLKDEFLSRPDVQPGVAQIEQNKKREHLAKEPVKLKKNGEVSKIYEKWKEKLDRIERGEEEDFRFNIQSGLQLTELLYDIMGFECKLYTEKGLRATSIKAVKAMGEVGSILVERNYLLKELGFMEKYLELTRDRGTIHPSFRLPGTVTGRCSSRDVNMQQVPKSKAVMGLFHAPPGRVWVDIDFAALEPMVTAEFTQDENMLFLYGSNAKPNDIYLFVGAHISSMSSKIRATGYDPYNPTDATIKKAKKECKKERGLCKTVALAAAYGAGVKKIQSILEADEIYIPYEEIEAIHSGYWDLFAGVKDYAKGLHYQWKRNKGYILNGTGRPMAVPENMTQDLLNRFIQSTGHDVLTTYVAIVIELLNKSGIEWSPTIMDFHDAVTVEVPEADGQRTAEVLNKAMDELNRRMGGTVRLRGVPVVGKTLADIKEPEA